MPRRRLAPEARRAELLTTAMNVLRERGPGDVRVEDITRAAGTAKGTFYVYFDSWDAMLTALRDQMLADYRAGVFARLAAAGDDLLTFLEGEVERFVDYQLELGPLHDALFHPGGPVPPALEESAPALIATLIRRGQETGDFGAVDVEPTAFLVFHAMHGAADDIAAGADRTRTLGALIQLLRAALRP